jgi:hypothetical protein
MRVGTHHVAVRSSDHAQHGKLLAQAGADGQHRRSSDVVVKLLDRVRCVAMPFVQEGRKPLSKAIVASSCLIEQKLLRFAREISPASHDGETERVFKVFFFVGVHIFPALLSDHICRVFPAVFQIRNLMGTDQCNHTRPKPGRRLEPFKFQILPIINRSHAGTI